MIRKYLVIFFLCLACPLYSSVLADDLFPYQLNRIIIEDERNLDSVKIYGQDYKNKRFLLFKTSVKIYQKRIVCIFYFDESIYSIEVVLQPAKGEPSVSNFDVGINPYRIGIYNSQNCPLPRNSLYCPVFSPDNLISGDIIICSGSQYTKAVLDSYLARGIHCLVLGSLSHSTLKSSE